MSSSKTTKYLLVVGARPNFMKIAPIHRAFSSRRNAQSTADLLLVHTGQHYSRNMSDDFFRDLGIPEPDINLEVGSGSHAEQTARIMMGFEPACLLGDFCRDLVAVGTASCEPALSVSKADLVAALTAIGSPGTSGMCKRECQDFS